VDTSYPRNLRLAHKLCNRLDFGKEPGHEKGRQKARLQQAHGSKGGGAGRIRTGLAPGLTTITNDSLNRRY
jgi:hypothetical protein